MKFKIRQLIQRLIVFLQKFVPSESESRQECEVTSSDNQIFGKSGGSIININGNKFSVSGRNVSVINDKIYVDGKLIKSGLSGVTKVEWIGPVANIDCTDLVVNGDVQRNVDATSALIKGSVGGDVEATSITVGGNVDGNVDGLTISVSGKVIGKIRK